MCWSLTYVLNISRLTSLSCLKELVKPQRNTSVSFSLTSEANDNLAQLSLKSRANVASRYAFAISYTNHLHDWESAKPHKPRLTSHPQPPSHPLYPDIQPPTVPSFVICRSRRESHFPAKGRLRKDLLRGVNRHLWPRELGKAILMSDMPTSSQECGHEVVNIPVKRAQWLRGNDSDVSH